MAMQACRARTKDMKCKRRDRMRKSRDIRGIVITKVVEMMKDLALYSTGDWKDLKSDGFSV